MHWEAIDGFASQGEYARFCAWIAAQVDAGSVEQVPVSEPSSDLIFGVLERGIGVRPPEMYGV